MEIGNAIQPQQYNQPINTARPAEVVAPKSHAATEFAVPKVYPNEESTMHGSEDERYAKIKDAMNHTMRDSYPVRDTVFTIFKDGMGQFITRVKNLRDGTVTYLPEPEIFKRLNSSSYMSVSA